ncbi:hypothetical protein AAFN60_07915 [Roseibacillus persicicus]|uniref:hypothetical protein n=1 Tax=Roseibacillus persicicus TaxID=454148 RepID=UPI00398BAAF0
MSIVDSGFGSLLQKRGQSFPRDGLVAASSLPSRRRSPLNRRFPEFIRSPVTAATGLFKRSCEAWRTLRFRNPTGLFAIYRQALKLPWKIAGRTLHNRSITFNLRPRESHPSSPELFVHHVLCSSFQ